MKTTPSNGLCVAVALFATATPAAAGTEDRPCVLIVVGAPGAPAYEARFRDWADHWQAAAAKASADVIRIGQAEEAGGTDRERLRTILAEKAAAVAGAGAGREPL